MREPLSDDAYMKLALSQAQSAARAGEVPVGALIVDPESGDIIASAHNHPISGHDPTGHAEIAAIRAAAKAIENYRLTGLTLYVTLEPCTMCAGAISHARLGRVVFGAADVKGGAVINGPRFFDSPSCHHRPDVTGGVMAGDAAHMLKAFFQARRKRKNDNTSI
ncbi:tRNA adenosine(34) deaminase TadA [Robiginitomaculum antarcticum]|uniref:tRNA adenosine(34) deaminase TadA n=1 Tax=Robiginitomaculum antarcticum TaxID=437507 RepID=UPI00037D51F0|nr:tRNA adenosine(34) deaminase TadA [Robiginitomaculum antarcticum]